MADRHWEQVSALVGHKVHPSMEDFTLTHFVEPIAPGRGVPWPLSALSGDAGAGCGRGAAGEVVQGVVDAAMLAGAEAGACSHDLTWPRGS